MKKFIIAFSLVFMFLFSNAFAQSTLFTVVNTSKSNQDAQISGAHPGDVLRYELVIESNNLGIDNFDPVVGISDVLEKTELIDMGFGSQIENEIIFPRVKGEAPIREEFTFFARVNEECPLVDRNINAIAHGENTNVRILCDLSNTGFAYNQTGLYGFLFVVFAIFALFVIRRFRS